MYRESQLKALFEGKRILIAGYGREGKSSEQLIRRLLPSADITIVEGNDNIKAEALKGYDLILKSPGIPTFVFEGLCNPKTLTSQTDIFLIVYGAQTIGITGTKGKSTTTNLIAAILQRHDANTLMAGNMGIPLFDIIPQIDEHTTIVCEFSCHQLENIHCGPHIGILLNLFEEHLDHYHSYNDYKLAKLQIGLQQFTDDYFFYCADNEELAQMVGKYLDYFPGFVQPYTIHDPIVDILRQMPHKLQGDHNLSNILVARHVAEIMGVDEQMFNEVVAEFDGLEHRMELVGTFSGITFYNDSISTIPAACIAAVNALKDVDTLILGGFDRGIDYTPLGLFLAQSKVRNIALVGQAGQRIKAAYLSALNGVQPVNMLEENDYQTIVAWAFQHTEKGKICLLSPAAASYDAFKNFEERGRIYKDLIKSHS